MKKKPRNPRVLIVTPEVTYLPDRMGGLASFYTANAGGLADVSEKLSAEASEEMGHAERIISRMLALGVAPNASQLRPVRLGHTLLELLQHDHAFEKELITLYDEATRHCARSGDHDNRVFFEPLLAEEQAHAQHLLEWLSQLQQTGSTG